MNRNLTVLADLCLFLLGSCGVSPAAADPSPPPAARSVGQRRQGLALSSVKGKVTWFKYAFDTPILWLSAPGCIFELDSAVGTALTAPILPMGPGTGDQALTGSSMCSLVLDSFKLGREITVEHTSGEVQTVMVSR